MRELTRRGSKERSSVRGIRKRGWSGLVKDVALADFEELLRLRWMESSMAAAMRSG